MDAIACQTRRQESKLSWLFMNTLIVYVNDSKEDDKKETSVFLNLKFERDLQNKGVGCSGRKGVALC